MQTTGTAAAAAAVALAAVASRSSDSNSDSSADTAAAAARRDHHSDSDSRDSLNQTVSSRHTVYTHFPHPKRNPENHPFRSGAPIPYKLPYM